MKMRIGGVSAIALAENSSPMFHNPALRVLIGDLMKSVFVQTCLFLAWCAAIPAHAETDILFVLDSSGSMNQVTAGKKQIDAAREALGLALNDIPADAKVGVRVYAHRVEQAKKEESCKDTELLIPFGTGNAMAIKTKLDALTPKGYTPIAYSLEQAAKDFSIEREAQRSIILLSDGEETCGGDPAKTIADIKASGIALTVHVIGFNVDAKTRAQLEGVATAGGGIYYDAKDSVSLTRAFQEATKKASFIDKEKSVYGKEIRGGDSFETAVALPEFGTELRLDHHQKGEFYDYFKFSVKEGQEVGVTLKTLEKGLQLNSKNQAVENGNPYACASLVDAKRKKIKDISIYGETFGTKAFSYFSPEKQDLFILIGCESKDHMMHKDHVSFAVTLTSRGDLETEIDAGVDIDSASPIEARRYKSNYLGGADEYDTYSFSGKKGEKYFVGIIPGPDFGTYFNVRVLDEYKQEIAFQSGKSGQGVKLETFEIPDDGTYYVQISLPSKEYPVISYVFDLKKVEEKKAEGE